MPYVSHMALSVRHIYIVYIHFYYTSELFFMYFNKPTVKIFSEQQPVINHYELFSIPQQHIYLNELFM